MRRGSSFQIWGRVQNKISEEWKNFFALKKLLPKRDAEVSNLRSTVSKCNTENKAARKTIENMQSRLSEADEAKEEAISVLTGEICKIKKEHEETKARYVAYKNTCEGQAQMIKELKIAKSDQELKLSHAEAELKQSAIEHASEMFELRSEHDALQKAIGKEQSELSQLRTQYDDINNRMQISKSHVILLKQCIRQNDEILKRKDNDIKELEYSRDALEQTLLVATMPWPNGTKLSLASLVN